MESVHIRQWIARHSGRIVAAIPDHPSVLVVDDHPTDWTGLGTILAASGISMNVTGEIPEYLLLGRQRGPLCVILDQKPGGECLDFQHRLAVAKVYVPIIFVTKFGDIPMSVAAMKNGAIDFLVRPLNEQELYSSIKIGLERDAAWTNESGQLSALAERYDTLTARERQVMEKVAAGRLNKQVGGDLGISEITVKAHRGQVMRKMKAKSLPDLARMADRIAQISQTFDAKLESQNDDAKVVASAESEDQSIASIQSRWVTRIRKAASRVLSISPRAISGEEIGGLEAYGNLPPALGLAKAKQAMRQFHQTS